MTAKTVNGRPTWRQANISRPERVGRAVLGVAAIAVGIVLLASAGPLWAVALKVLLVAAGLDLVITGASGHCPLYQKLGHVRASRRAVQRAPVGRTR